MLLCTILVCNHGVAMLLFELRHFDNGAHVAEEIVIHKCNSKNSIALAGCLNCLLHFSTTFMLQICTEIHVLLDCP